ncbi:MAG: rhamnogalacturonan lyase [Pirellulales bacterium]|nr:rhamnogalacturonan lyase [Pirellulales bacterium]
MIPRRPTLALPAAIFAACCCTTSLAERQREQLDRGVVAVRTGDEAVVLWRLLPDDPAGATFHVSRRVGDGSPVRLTAEPLSGPTRFVDATYGDVRGQAVEYLVQGAGTLSADRTEDGADNPTIPAGRFALPADAADVPYLAIPIRPPFGYQAGDASIGDLDGDGAYEIVVHMVGVGRDNSQNGFTTPPWLHAYKLTGERLWAINLGPNIREGAHYTQFMVYDFDGDGRAEVACKTADGTVDGAGRVIGDPHANHVNAVGRILAGPEFLTVFDGRTGAALDTADYIPPRGDVAAWGDRNGNRSDRFLACVAFLDGRRPSLVTVRGYYTRTVVAAWDFRDGKLAHRWTFDSDAGDESNRAYRGQGNHHLAVADVDGDGRDEIIHGSCVIDDDGQGLHATGLGHGDALHAADHIPERPGLEIFKANGDGPSSAGIEMRDACTGERIWGVPCPGRDGVVRACAIDIDPRYPGSECWGFGAGVRGLFAASGERIADRSPRVCNMGVWWDGDPQRELLNGVTVSKWNPESERDELVFDGREFGAVSINGSKSNPCLCADLLGDWREEIVAPSADGTELRIFVSTEPTPHRATTLMNDPVYRLGIAWQNVGYNQPAHLGFDLAERLEERQGGGD